VALNEAQPAVRGLANASGFLLLRSTKKAQCGADGKEGPQIALIFLPKFPFNL
jgi:hypothetical protein